jgi:glycosyltransferase involved in cell wall biosynthesis
MSDTRVTVCQLLLTLHTGGAEMLAARLALRLSDRHRFVFVCLEESGVIGEKLRAEGYDVHVLGKRPGIDRRAAWRLRAVLRSERVDLIHAHQYGPFFYSSMARWPSGRPPIVLTEHGRTLPDPRRAGHALANRLLLRSRDRLYGVGDHVARALVKVEGFPSHRVGVIYNGINADAFANRGGLRSEVRRELGFGEDDLVIIQVARLDPLKDHSTALRTLEHLLQRRPNTHLVLVGDGPQAGIIQTEIAARGLDRHVSALGLRSDVARLMAGADLALLTSVSEGIPLVLIEAMATGLPVVATSVGGVPELVLDGLTGLLAPTGNDSMLATHVLRLAEDLPLRLQMGTLAQERVRTIFSEDRMVKAYDQAYREARGIAHAPALLKGD